jgi:hypothetical protein
MSTADNNGFDLTKKEKKIISSLSSSQQEYFDDHFWKISKRMWRSTLKHYVETYSVDDCIVICEGYDFE